MSKFTDMNTVLSAVPTSEQQKHWQLERKSERREGKRWQEREWDREDRKKESE